MGKCGNCKHKGHCDTTSELYGVPKYNGGCQYYEKRSEDMGTNYYLVKNKPSIDSGLHIGKSSYGWRFLFHRPSCWDVDVPLNTFEQWRDYLKETTESGTHVIMNEYDEIVSYEDFIKMVQEKQSFHKSDMFEHCDNVNGYRFSSAEFS